MNRRTFLQLSSASTAAYLLPIPAFAVEWPKTEDVPAAWWALSDFTYMGPYDKAASLSIDKRLVLQGISGTYRWCAAPGFDLLFQSHQLIEVSPLYPRAVWSAVIRQPDNEWGCVSSTQGYVPLGVLPKGRVEEE